MNRDKVISIVKFFICIFLFLLAPLFQLIPINIFNIDPSNMDDITKILLKLFSYLFVILIVYFMYYKTINKDFKKFNIKKIKNKDFIYNLDTSFRYYVIGLIIMLVTNFIIGKLGIGTSNNDQNVVNLLKDVPLLGGIYVILLGPILEELVFRLSFKDVFKSKYFFIFISGIVFGSIHVIFNVTDVFELLYLIPYCSLGISFGFIYYETDNISYSLVFHILHNFITAFVTFLLAGVVL